MLFSSRTVSQRGVPVAFAVGALLSTMILAGPASATDQTPAQPDSQIQPQLRLTGGVTKDQVKKFKMSLDLTESAPGAQTSIDEEGTYVQRVKGQIFELRQDGTWTVSSEKDHDASMVTAKSGWGVKGCTGSMVQVHKDGISVEWGAQQTCTNAYFPQGIRGILQNRSNFPSAYRNKSAIVRAPKYQRVVVLSAFHQCVTTSKRQFKQRFYPTVKGIEYAVIDDSTQPWVNCDWPS